MSNGLTDSPIIQAWQGNVLTCKRQAKNLIYFRSAGRLINVLGMSLIILVFHAVAMETVELCL